VLEELHCPLSFCLDLEVTFLFAVKFGYALWQYGCLSLVAFAAKHTKYSIMLVYALSSMNNRILGDAVQETIDLLCSA